jgi:hypothetical protein
MEWLRPQHCAAPERIPAARHARRKGCCARHAYLRPARSADGSGLPWALRLRLCRHCVPGSLRRSETTSKCLSRTYGCQRAEAQLGRAPTTVASEQGTLTTGAATLATPFVHVSRLDSMCPPRATAGGASCHARAQRACAREGGARPGIVQGQTGAQVRLHGTLLCDMIVRTPSC